MLKIRFGTLMKNIYQIPGAYQVKQEDFRFNILYTDPSPLNYITEVTAGSPFPSNPNHLGKQKIKSLKHLYLKYLDKLNYNDPQTGDGFDFSAKFNDGCAIRSNYFSPKNLWRTIIF
jgi:cell surface protein SprA